MKKSGFSEEQIIGILREQEAGDKTAEICRRHGISQATVESFNGRLRDDCLNETLFHGLRHARQMLADWRDDYNNIRPHSTLSGMSPAQFATFRTGGMPPVLNVNLPHNQTRGLHS